MTTEDLIAIAKACGFQKCAIGDDDCWIKEETHQTLPNYNSLDSMQQAVLMQDEEFQKAFDENLNNKCFNFQTDKWGYIHQLTVPDWQQAFVETLKQLKR